MKIVEILGSKIGTFTKLKGKLKQVIKILGMGKDDVQEIDQVANFGIDSVPIKGMRGVQANTSTRGDAVIIGYINQHALAKEGETRLYSIDADGNLATALHLKADGTMEIGGNSDFMVRFGALESGFNQLRSDLNIHTHASAGAPSLPVSVANISGAKITTIKTS